MPGSGKRESGVVHATCAAVLIAALGGLAVAAQSKAPAASPSGGNGKLYIGTYSGDIQIFDEATEKMTERIVLKTGIPRQMVPSQDRSRFYVLDSTYEQIEVVDIAGRRTIDTFNLRAGNARKRVVSMQADPLNRFLVLMSRTATKLSDRWEIGPPTIELFDLTEKKVTRTIPWPGNEEREFLNMRFSPDGKFAYVFGDDVVVLDTAEFKEVETWPYSQTAEPGLGRVNLGPVHDFYDAPGTFTGLFTILDPVAKRRIMGIGRVELAAKKIDFRPIGPAENISFAQAPDHKRAYGIKSEIGRYEFWTFDLEKASVVSRAEFKGRPRMGLRVSSNGKLIYIYVAGATIDVYDAASYKYLRTIQMNADQTTELYVVPGATTGSTAR